MNCMKCGREIGPDQVFCTDCLVDMERYPVKPSTVVQLPKRGETAAPRKGHFRPILTPEEQIRKLKKRIHRLISALVVVLLLFAGLAFYFARHLQTHNQLRPGQNFSVVTSEESSEP